MTDNKYTVFVSKTFTTNSEDVDQLQLIMVFLRAFELTQSANHQLLLRIIIIPSQFLIWMPLSNDKNIYITESKEHRSYLFTEGERITDDCIKPMIACIS